MPYWYPILRAAKYLGESDPEVLLHRPPTWTHRALMAERAEQRAAEDKIKYDW
jgi:hypothetical protein